MRKLYCLPVFLAVAILLGLGRPSITMADDDVKIRCRQGGRVLDAYTPDLRNNGCRMHLWDDIAVRNQQWRLVPHGSGTYRILCLDGGRVLDAHGDDVGKDGCRVQLWQFLGGQNQLWRLEALGGGFTKIVCVRSGKCLDAHIHDTDKNGCVVQLWDYLGGQNQQWRIVRGGPPGGSSQTAQRSGYGEFRHRVDMVYDRNIQGPANMQNVHTPEAKWIRYLMHHCAYHQGDLAGYVNLRARLDGRRRLSRECWPKAEGELKGERRVESEWVAYLIQHIAGNPATL